MAEWADARGPLRMMYILGSCDLPLEAARHAGICRMLDCRRLGGGASATRAVVRTNGAGGTREEGHDEDEREAAEPIWAGYASVLIEKDYYARRLFPRCSVLLPGISARPAATLSPFSLRLEPTPALRDLATRAALSTRPPVAFWLISRCPVACRSLRRIPRRRWEFSSISRTSSAVGQRVRSTSVLS